jgi:hypothetical protein
MSHKDEESASGSDIEEVKDASNGIVEDEETAALRADMNKVGGPERSKFMCRMVISFTFEKALMSRGRLIFYSTRTNTPSWTIWLLQM